MSVPVSPTPEPPACAGCSHSERDHQGYGCRWLGPWTGYARPGCSCTGYDPAPVSSPTPDEQAAEEAAERYRHMIGADLPMEERRRRALELLARAEGLTRPEPTLADNRVGSDITEALMPLQAQTLLPAVESDPDDDYEVSAPEAVAPFGCGNCSDLAALVVVREQLTQAQREAEVWRREQMASQRALGDIALSCLKPAALLDDRELRAAYDAVRAVLSAPPSPPTYTTEEPS